MIFIFLSVKKHSEIEININRSRFIGNVIKVNNEDEAKDFIKDISRNYKNATHNCWAYKIFDKREIFNFSDNGEPSGTAGKPILGAIEMNNLINVVIVVTRFYGGVKLGVRGLINAYGETASLAIKDAEICEFKKALVYDCKADYSKFNEIEKLLKRIEGWKFREHNFAADVNFKISVLEENFEEVMNVIEKKSFKFEKIGEDEVAVNIGGEK